MKEKKDNKGRNNINKLDHQLKTTSVTSDVRENSSDLHTEQNWKDGVDSEPFKPTAMN